MIKINNKHNRFKSKDSSILKQELEPKIQIKNNVYILIIHFNFRIIDEVLVLMHFQDQNTIMIKYRFKIVLRKVCTNFLYTAYFKLALPKNYLPNKSTNY